MKEVLSYSLSQIKQGFKKKDFSVKQLCQFYLDRILKYNSAFNAVICTNKQALVRAEFIDNNFDKYQDKALFGVPVLLKDVFCTKGLCTTAGSKMLANFIPPYSAEIVHRLENAGAIILGKCNQDEFAMGNSNETSYFAKAYNPWNKAYVPGGSSGGSAISVAMGLSPVSIGSDTGGSIRGPAGFCNVVGIKPTYGRVSRYGMIAYASSLDQAGPLTNTVEDSALVLEVLSGWDAKDSTSLNEKVPSWRKNLTSQSKTDLTSFQIGLYLGPHPKDLSKDVREVLQHVCSLLERAGASITPLKIPSLEVAVPAYYLISTSEASSNLARYDGIRYGYRPKMEENKKLKSQEFYSHTRAEGFGQEVKRRILMGTFCLSHGYYDKYYNKACKLRHFIRNELIKVLPSNTLLISPVSSTPAWKIGQAPAGSLESYINDQFTVPANLAGMPALSVPAGFSSQKGLPIGVQLMATHFNEQALFDVAYFIQNKLKIQFRRPNV